MKVPQLVAVLLVSYIPIPAVGQGISTPIIGTSRSSAATADPTAVYFNPAMTAHGRGPQLLVGGALIVGDISYQRDYRGIYQREDALDFVLPISASAVDASKQGRQDEVRSNPIAAAPALFVTLPLSETVHAGLGVYAPFAAAIAFPRTGAQRFQLQEAFIATVNVTSSLSWRPRRWLSFGAGVSYVVGFAELSKVQDFAALPDVGTALNSLGQTNDFGPQAPIGVRELDVMARPIVLQNMWAHSMTFNAGVAWEPTEGLVLGLTYQHETPMTFHGDFELDMDDDFFNQDLESQGLAYPERVRGEAELNIPLPGSLRLSSKWQLTSSLGLAIDVAYTFWSIVDTYDVVVRSPDLAQPDVGLPSFSTIALQRRWRNTVGIDLLGDFRVSEAVLLYVRGGFRQAAVPDETIDAASPDGDRILFVGGLSIQLNRSLTLQGELGTQTTLARRARSSDFDLGNGAYRLTLWHGGLFVAARL